MYFEKGQLYHIYNQGNNRQNIFFERENYLFFLKKMRMYLWPYCDILAYCLMSNHFHIMVRVNFETLWIDTEGFAQSEALVKNSKQRTINQSIGLLLRSYTNAINKQNNTTGSLFRKETKAECLTQTNGITPSFYNTKTGTQIHINKPKDQYPQVCFNYIHQNPVKSGLVQSETNWEFSSAQDYAKLRKGTIVNKDVASRYLTYSSADFKS